MTSFELQDALRGMHTDLWRDALRQFPSDVAVTLPPGQLIAQLKLSAANTMAIAIKGICDDAV